MMKEPDMVSAVMTYSVSHVTYKI